MDRPVSKTRAKKIRKLIRDNNGEGILLVDNTGHYTRGRIDFRDAIDRYKKFGMISDPGNMMTSHKYTEVREIYSLTDEDAEGFPSQLL